MIPRRSKVCDCSSKTIDGYPENPDEPRQILSFLEYHKDQKFGGLELVRIHWVFVGIC
jgi:hypothetical protein